MNLVKERLDMWLGFADKTSLGSVTPSPMKYLPNRDTGPDIVQLSSADFQAHLLRLTRADRYSRFGLCMADDNVCSYVNRAETGRGRAFGFMEQGHVRGAVELRHMGNRAGCAELAVTVDADWRGRGYGTWLVQCALDIARTMPVTTVVAIISGTNRSMRTMTSKLGAAIVEEGDGLRVEWAIGREARETSCAGCAPALQWSATSGGAQF